MRSLFFAALCLTAIAPLLFICASTFILKRKMFFALFFLFIFRAQPAAILLFFLLTGCFYYIFFLSARVQGFYCEDFRSFPGFAANLTEM